ncbi:MAG: hypothetical protein ACOH2H_08100 [Cypionkella sp.]
MQAIVPKSHPKLVDVSYAPTDRFLALDCAAMFAPDGPIPQRNVTHRKFDDLTPAEFAELAPTTVVMLLFSGAQDALLMVEALESLGFRGNIFVIAPPLPRPAVVERELRLAGPGDRLMLVSP